MSDELKYVTSVLASWFSVNEMYGGCKFTARTGHCGMYVHSKKVCHQLAKMLLFVYSHFMRN